MSEKTEKAQRVIIKEDDNFFSQAFVIPSRTEGNQIIPAQTMPGATMLDEVAMRLYAQYLSAGLSKEEAAEEAFLSARVWLKARKVHIANP